MTNPRFDEGRPVTLGIVRDDGLISGYPDYSWHDNQGTNCDGMTSVFRVAVSSYFLVAPLKSSGNRYCTQVEYHITQCGDQSNFHEPFSIIIFKLAQLRSGGRLQPRLVTSYRPIGKDASAKRFKVSERCDAV